MKSSDGASKTHLSHTHEKGGLVLTAPLKHKKTDGTDRPDGRARMEQKAREDSPEGLPQTGHIVELQMHTIDMLNAKENGTKDSKGNQLHASGHDYYDESEKIEDKIKDSWATQADWRAKRKLMPKAAICMASWRWAKNFLALPVWKLTRQLSPIIRALLAKPTKPHCETALCSRTTDKFIQADWLVN